MKLVYDEWYGQLSYKQRAAYRKYNVSTSDHQDLVDMLGEDNHQAITDFVEIRSPKGMYISPFNTVEWDKALQTLNNKLGR